MAALLDSLTSLATPAVGPIAERLGETDAAVSSGIQTSIASVLGGLIGKTKDPGAIRQIFDLISNRPAGADLTGDVRAMVGRAAAGAPTSGAAGSLLTTLFGGKMNAVGDLITRTVGFKNPSSGSSLLGLAAPLVLGFFGKQVRENGLNLGGLSNMLVGERESILAAAPPGLANLVATAPAMPHVETGEVLGGAAASKKMFVEPPKEAANRSRWIWPLIGIAAVTLTWFVVSRRNAPVPELAHPSVTTGAAAVDSAAGRTGAAIKAAAGEVSEAVAGLGAFVKRMLPGGIELTIPERGIESKLIAFIEDSSRPVSDTTWFDFDRLNFATGSARILPESQEQLDNIVAVLKAYPNVNVKVGGYTDNVGTAAANLQLSQRRADAVRKALVDNGIPANRLQAEGYGEKHPVADNATDEGRARNRRIALKVTKK